RPAGARPRRRPHNAACAPPRPEAGPPAGPRCPPPNDATKKGRLPTPPRRAFPTATSGLAAAALTREAWAQGAGGLAQSGLVGQLEGSQVVTDPARIPRTFKEAPELAALVQQGRLPPVAQRLPQEPLVLQPLNEFRR